MGEGSSSPAPDTPAALAAEAEATAMLYADVAYHTADDGQHRQRMRTANLLRRLAAALPNPVPEEAREEIASVLEQVARDGLPQPRDLDVAIDAILSILAGD